MKINDRVYVSVLSKSKVAGEVGIVRAISARGEVKVENDFGVVGYPNIRHVSINEADAPMIGLNVQSIDPTDLLTRAVVFQDFFTAATIGGFVTDQWIEDGVELLNIVHDGSFSVVPRSQVICTMKRVPQAGPKAYTVDSYI